MIMHNWRITKMFTTRWNQNNKKDNQRMMNKPTNHSWVEDQNNRVNHALTNNRTMAKSLVDLPPECYELIAGYLRYKELVRASMTCQDFWKAYFDIQGRMKEIRAKNIDSRRKRRALFTQLRATKGLEILSLVNVQHPCTENLFSQVSTMTSLRELNLSGSNLTGSIPETLGDLKHLKTLCLANNKLTGKLPISLGNCKELESIKLSFNQLEGPIPDAWAGMKSIRFISISYNKLSGEVPEFLAEMPNLESLLLGGNKFTGKLPKTLGSLVHLSSLYLFQNELQGPIPEELGHCKSLHKILLNGNQLSGKIPDNIGQLNELQELVVSGNSLEGALPDAMERLENLQTLDLQNNNFTQNAPRTNHVLRVMRERGCQVFM